MHIPDGFIDGKTAVTTAALSAAGLGLALRQVRRTLPPRRVPLLGLGAAFLFAAQMVNFPVAGGTSGHLLGGVLVGALLGPSAAVVVLTTVLLVQSFLFADGGITALGANVFNMALVGGVGGYVIYRFVCAWLPGTRGQVAAVAFAGWCSTVLASISCAGQLAWSHTLAWSIGFPAMASVHMLIGIGEGLISALVYLAIQRVRPDLSETAGTNALPARGPLIGYGLLVAVGIAVFVAPFACSRPDGLESVAAKFGWQRTTTAPALLPAVAPEYRLPGLDWAPGATAVAGAAGSIVVFWLAQWLARSLVQKPAPKPISPHHD